MAGMSALELETLWTEFHGVVNMTSQEIGVVLQADPESDSGTESRSEAEWTSTGLRVLEILQKRRSELTEDDTRVMYDVVERVEDFAPDADGRPSREQLMRLGHDPLRSAPEGSL